jgi:sn-glycerol 3-phosphate transport system permease protein
MRQMIGNGDAQTEWQLIMATALLAIVPPVAVVVMMQRWFVKGLVESEK